MKQSSRQHTRRILRCWCCAVAISVPLLISFKSCTQVPGTISSQLPDVPSSALVFNVTSKTFKDSQLLRRRCALNFFGLPRAFKRLVLPSMIANIIIPNIQYDCDYFVHFYNITYEPPSRSGKGGHITPEDVYLLRDAVHTIALQAGRPLPHVGFV
ncbi:hypothetical protein MHU86_18980 [Fragilaria crotonensis]|nr:hypothetical protein MHU86_18980 [Fragilaria crotonensis]